MRHEGRAMGYLLVQNVVTCHNWGRWGLIKETAQGKFGLPRSDVSEKSQTGG